MSKLGKLNEFVEKLKIESNILKLIIFFVLLILGIVLVLTLSFAIFTGIASFILFIIDFFAGTAYLTLQNALICGLILMILKIVFN